MSAWEIGCVAVMLLTCTATLWLSRRQRQKLTGLARSTEPLIQAEQQLAEVLCAAEERHQRMLEVIGRAERAIALQGALKFGDCENPNHSFRDAERLLAGGIPVGEVAERLALPRTEVELLARVCRGNGRTLATTRSRDHG